MTQDEAIAKLAEWFDSESGWNVPVQAVAVAYATLRGAQPDPITGLVPCGCGGNARIKHDGSYSTKCITKNADETVRYESATVVYPGHTHAWVDCDNNKCRCSVGYCGGLIFRTDEEARDAWNVAMGYTAPPLPGAIGPDATPFGFERIGGDWEETAE